MPTEKSGQPTDRLAGRLLINNEAVRGSGAKFKSANPATQAALWSGNAASASDVGAAVGAASEAFSAWSDASLSEREEHLRAFADLASKRKDTIADAISAEAGKPHWEALTEAAAVAGKLSPTLEAHKLRAETLTRPAGAATSVTRFRPHGVVAVLGPYNFPAHMPNGHVMPALLAGNTVVLKPSEQTPYVGEVVAELWRESGLPAGVLNLVQGGVETADALIRHPSVRGIFLTGSPAAGTAILREVRDDRSKMVALELGGNSPIVVWDYADLATTVNIVVQSTFITSGQRCSAARRLIMRDDDSLLLPALTAALSRLRVGLPSDDPEPYMGPVISNAHADSLLGQQASLIDAGGDALLEMRRLRDGIPLLSPGLIDMTNSTTRTDDEIFGPILQVVRVRTFEDAIKEANRTEYGLAAAIVSLDRARYDQFANSVEAGVIAWNQQLTGASALAPFGGLKASGNYRPSGFLAVDYCVRAVGALEVESPVLPTQLPPGLNIS